MLKLYPFLLFVSIALAQTPGVGVVDIDGNTYASVIIGNQEWAVGNLNVTKYNNGDIIPERTTANNWHDSPNGAWSNYLNDPSNGTIYGKIYDWDSVTDPRGLAPEGWHIPTKAEWDELIAFVGGPATAGIALKSTTLWNTPNVGATNSSGFSAIPNGIRYYDGNFSLPAYFGSSNAFWTTTEFTPGAVYSFSMSSATTAVNNGYYPATAGYAIRFLKDSGLKTGESSPIRFRLYPNPTHGQLHCESQKGQYTIELFTVFGQSVLKQIVSDGKAISLSGFSKGMYIAKITDVEGKFVGSHKIILE
ncbi:T9SS type A sorting domain-containing protein [Flavobacterium sp. MAH-1]|uniref:T9SS type A sorting domain-containing protein n=1 Tax=Flavobacterium agri TaxID=2743471 RepID=A0A7Y8Y2L8_9FLAO|nr:FISUMP domain-containing protein [Flavobacterium agri]NUY81435.1 T9SS type A sorting domain-containing protein [Flavobacterium agri]NYA71459.1 T9SS type A sorting domain-containing protein [Flavobacterium agri]